RGAAAVEWIRHNPSRFLALTAARFRMFWFPDADGSPWYARSIAFVTIAAIIGLALLAKRRQAIILFFGSALLVYPLLYYVVLSAPRYRTPFLWIPLLAAGYFLARIIRFFKPAPPQLAAKRPPV